MKVKLYSILSIFLLSVLSVNARQLTPEESFALFLSNMSLTKRSGAKPVLVNTVKASYNPEFTGVYVFNTGESFVVLPADDAFTSVLGFGDGDFEVSEEMPPALQELLRGYADQVYEMAASNDLESDYSFSIPDVSTWTPVEPLITSKWGQNQPYNNLIPPGTKYPVGCVSLSMGQVMRYHQWPSSGRGSISYRLTGNDIYIQQISMDFSEVTFDWDNMPNALVNSSAADKIKAVATLLKATGASVYMSYSTSVSLAYSQMEPMALYKYFDYSPLMRHVEADYYSPGEWTWMVYNQLSQGIPLIYGGNGGYGHSFICDGFKPDKNKQYFHFNWGWKGTDDGYYLLNNLNPSSNFNSGPFNKNIEMLINMVKPETEINNIETDPLLYLRGDLYIWNTAEIKLGSVAYFFQANNGLRNVGATEVEGFPGFLFVNNETGRRYVAYDASARTIGVPEFVGSDEAGFRYNVNTSGGIKILLPESMDEGVYTAMPIFKPEGSESFVRVLCPINSPSTVTMEVASNTAKFSDNKIVRLNAYNINYEFESNSDGSFRINCIVYNPTNKTVDASLGVRLVDPTGVVVAYIDTPVSITLNNGAETFVSFEGVFNGLENLKHENYSIDIYDLETGIPLGLTSLNDPVFNPGPAGVDQVTKEENAIKIYPNPADTYVKIEAGQLIREINIYDLTGRLVKHISESGVSNYTVNVDNLSAGIYIVTIQMESGFMQRSRIIVR